ncbi:MAG: zinc ribbon domain-containing protein [bacterium]
MVCAKCGAKITAERKKGRYIYYHCTGMKPGGCDLVYVREADVVDQFSDLLGPLVLTRAQASKIMKELSSRHRTTAERTQAERQRISVRLGQIDTWTEQAYQDKLENTITTEHWKTLSAKWEAEQIRLQSQLEALNGNGPDILYTAERILELSQKLPDLWLSRNNDEKRELVDLLYWNCSLAGATLSAAYKKPFSIIAEGTQTQKWRG